MARDLIAIILFFLLMAVAVENHRLTEELRFVMGILETPIHCMKHKPFVRFEKGRE